VIKNRTSGTPADRSVAYIERRLVGQKAKHIMKEYGPEGELSALCFIIDINGKVAGERR
jgi:hypothetical protein